MIKTEIFMKRAANAQDLSIRELKDLINEVEEAVKMEHYIVGLSVKSPFKEVICANMPNTQILNYLKELYDNKKVI